MTLYFPEIPRTGANDKIVMNFMDYTDRETSKVMSELEKRAEFGDYLYNLLQKPQISNIGNGNPEERLKHFKIGASLDYRLVSEAYEKQNGKELPPITEDIVSKFTGSLDSWNRVTSFMSRTRDQLKEENPMLGNYMMQFMDRYNSSNIDLIYEVQGFLSMNEVIGSGLDFYNGFDREKQERIERLINSSKDEKPDMNIKLIIRNIMAGQEN